METEIERKSEGERDGDIPFIWTTIFSETGYTPSNFFSANTQTHTYSHTHTLTHMLTQTHDMSILCSLSHPCIDWGIWVG